MFLLPDINLKLRPKILDLKPGTRIVSNTFTMGDWKADETADLAPTDGGCNEVAGAPRCSGSCPPRSPARTRPPQGELTLKQEFQMLTGTLRAEGQETKVEGRVRGTQVTLAGGGKEFRGRLNGARLELQ